MARIPHCWGSGIGWWLTAPIPPLAWEPPYAVGAAQEIVKKTKNKNKNKKTDGWIRKMWYIYTMEYYSAVKKNDVMPFTATWIELETLILSEMSQKDKDKSHMISLITGI